MIIMIILYFSIINNICYNYNRVLYGMLLLGLLFLISKKFIADNNSQYGMTTYGSIAHDVHSTLVRSEPLG